MNNTVNYTLALTPENAEKIDQINRIILGETYSAEATTKKPTTKAAPKSEAPKKEVEKAEPEVTEEPVAESAFTLDDIKKAAKKAKKDHGEDFANSVLDDLGVKSAASLGRRMSAIDESLYGEVISLWEAGPVTTADDLDDDDWGDDEDDTPEVSAEAVKAALKAYAKDVGRNEAKDIMVKHGAAALSKVDDCTNEQLAAMMKELV